MAGVIARRGAVVALVAAFAGVGMLLPPPARSVEAFDGALQAHGFAEMQIRGLSRNFEEELDLAQWYNVLNLEIEWDAAPSGFGPFDLVEAYVRVEARYDCVWKRSCGMFESANTYGDRAKRLPGRLRDATDVDYGGSIQVGDPVRRITNERPTEFVPTTNRRGFPGVDTLFDQPGGDFQNGTEDDPARYTNFPILEYNFALIETRGPKGNPNTSILPWRPKDFVEANGLLADRANPFRRREPARGIPNNFFTGSALAGKPRPNQLLDGTGDPLDPRLAAFVNPDGSLVLLGNGIDTVIPNGQGTYATPLFINTGRSVFGGDYSGTVPCFEPDDNSLSFAQLQITGAAENAGCIPRLNTRITGGTAELPFRPAPDKSNFDIFDPEVAQGLYLPSSKLRQALQSEHLDNPNMNFREAERALNRGSSQQDEKELKEAYLDIEMFDSRLWMRLGKQNIVWGKTELFRTTDQFNPQDFALASLPSLEESRVPLWAARFVYSLYDVGPLEDVRLEFGANFDQFEPADLGACGEPYTIDAVCGISTGLLAHGLLGVGIAGIDRPENPWDDISGLEVGGRIEFRWDRFSFAITDFYGYSDFPFVDRISTYERNVDPNTGRPRVAEAAGPCRRAFVHTNDGSSMVGFSGLGIDPSCLKPGGTAGDVNANRFAAATFADPANSSATGFSQLAITGHFNTIASDASPQNALENHSVNQQLFAWICASTVSIVSSLDPGACGFSIFNTNEPIPILGQPFSEVFGIGFAGDQAAQQLLRAIMSSQAGSNLGAQAPAIPIRPLNRDPDRGPLRGDIDTVRIDANGDGVFDLSSPVENPGTAVRIGGDGENLTTSFPTFLSLDATLSPQQKALMGCGPYYGTRCDSAVPNNLFIGVGGVDFMNTEGSALVQAWPGFEGTSTAGLNGRTSVADHTISNDISFAGTAPGSVWTTTSRTLLQPGTVGDLDGDGFGESFEGGPVCTRFVDGEVVILPGCRGAQSYQITTTGDPNTNMVSVVFQEGYLPAYDGCVFADSIGSGIEEHSVVGFYPAADGSADPSRPVDLTPCADSANGGVSSSRTFTPPVNPTPPPVFALPDIMTVDGAQTLWHPLAGCLDDADVFAQEFDDGLTPANEGDPSTFVECRWFERDFDREFLFPGDVSNSGRIASVFQSEMAAWSWNTLMFLTISSCGRNSKNINGETRREDLDPSTPGIQPNPRFIGNDPECFNPAQAYRPGKCSLVTPHFCSNVKGFFATVGVQRNTRRAAGNAQFGRRTFIWQSGGEIVLSYEKRNVLGFSMDFAEDVTKSNWGMEFTWIEGLPFTNNDRFDNTSKTGAFNLTVSVDRPTFINFLNPNRTFFINSQWFFQYLEDYENGMTFNGPFNVLFTVAVFTGYFQDRVLPQLVTVYDFNSRSAALLPSVAYRFTENFSATLGFLVFWGRTELNRMPVNEIGPASNRAGPEAYTVGVDNLLSLVRNRDEVFLRLRWTF